MTLAQYKAQTEPVRMPTVILNEGEYSIIVTIDKGTVNELSLVSIEGFNHEYALKAGSKRLYSTDQNGNPRSLSCFRIA